MVKRQIGRNKIQTGNNMVVQQLSNGSSSASNKKLSILAVLKLAKFYVRDYLRHQKLVKTHQIVVAWYFYVSFSLFLF